MMLVKLRYLVINSHMFFLQMSQTQASMTWHQGLAPQRCLLLILQRCVKKLSSLKTDKSPGPDNLHPKVLYEIRHKIAGYLRDLFEESVETGKVSFDWKSAQITVLHKKGAKCEVSNYRPVSLTCGSRKVLETIIRDHILCHFRLNNIFSKNQYVFIKVGQLLYNF